MARVPFFGLVAGVIAAPAVAQAAAGPCKPVFDAMLKVAMTPHHAVTTKDGSPAGELISTGDATYVVLRSRTREFGAWRNPLDGVELR